MPRTYKQPFKKKYRNISPNNPKPPPPSTVSSTNNTGGILNGFMSNMVQGFSFGTGVQAAKEMFSSGTLKEPQYTPEYIPDNSSNYCIEIKKKLDECNASMQYDCTFLSDLMRQKCVE